MKHVDWQSIRLSVYVLAFVAIGWFILRMHLVESQSRYEDGDLSAFAWTGFWPFIYPLFWAYSGEKVAPVAVVIEIGLWIRRRL